MLRFDKVEYRTFGFRGNLDSPHFLNMRFHFRAGRTLYIVCSWPEFCLHFAGDNHWYPGIVWVNGVVLNCQKHLLNTLRLALLDFLEREPCLTRHPAHDAHERRGLLALADRLEAATTVRRVRKERATTPSRFEAWRGNLWKLTKPRVKQIDEVLFATGYLDGGSIKVQFRVGERVHVLWAKRPRRRRSQGYDYWYTGYVILNGWLLDRQTERLEELRQAILDFLNRPNNTIDPDDASYLHSVVQHLEEAKNPRCIRKQKVPTKAEQEESFKNLLASIGKENLDDSDAS
jgi:hypothetical protein